VTNTAHTFRQLPRKVYHTLQGHHQRTLCLDFFLLLLLLVSFSFSLLLMLPIMMMHQQLHHHAPSTPQRRAILPPPPLHRQRIHKRALHFPHTVIAQPLPKTGTFHIPRRALQKAGDAAGYEGHGAGGIEDDDEVGDGEEDLFLAA